MLYAVITICSLCAAVQGMDETVVNGAQIFYKKQFGIGDDNSQRGKSKLAHSQDPSISNKCVSDSWLVGLVNGKLEF